MSKKELIEGVRENGRVLGLLSEEEKDFINNLPFEALEYLDHNLQWKTCYGSPWLAKNLVYRISPDYNPEPEEEFEVCEVFIDRGCGHVPYYAFLRGITLYDLSLALSMVDFAGVQFEGQSDKNEWPLNIRMFINENGVLSIFEETDYDGKPAIPTRIRFRKGA